MSSFNRMPVKTISAMLLIIDSWTNGDVGRAGQFRRGRRAANCDARARAVICKAEATWRNPIPGKRAAIFQRPSHLRRVLLVGLLEQRLGLGVDAGGEAGGGVRTGNRLGLTQLLPARRQAIRSTILRPLIDTMFVIVVWAWAVACGRRACTPASSNHKRLSLPTRCGRWSRCRPARFDRHCCYSSRLRDGIEHGA